MESGLLEKLKNLQENFLEDVDLINNLENSQKFSMEIREKVEISKVTEVKINDASEFYRPAAIRGALVYFVMNELYKMSSFYMYSLESYLEVIVQAIKIIADEYESKEKKEEDDTSKISEEKIEEEEVADEKGEKKEEEKKKEEDEDIKELTKEEKEKIKERVKKLTQSITYESFNYVRRGLFENHKTIFSTFLCLKILENQKILKSEEINHLIYGKILSSCPPAPENVRGYLTDQMWRNSKAMDYIEELSELCDNLDHDHLHWKKWFSEEKVEEIPLPKKFKDSNEFHKLMVIRALRPDRVSSALRNFVQ